METKVEITQDEFRELQALRAQKAEQDAETKKAEDREAYRKMEREFVDQSFGQLVRCSSLLAEAKAEIVEGSDELIKLKEDLFGAKSTQMSHSFMSSDGERRIKVGYTIRDGWDNTAEDGVRIISQYITSVPDADAKAKELASIVSEFLTRDKNGSLRLDNIITLERKAQELGITEVIKGVAIIREAYRPLRTKRYVRAERRDKETGSWINIPLGMTEA
ncbi:MAG: DUF3164 family protein [Porphyromonas sp.]|nr:DUF3164 family protein [Porphyromonas sp.]